MRATKAILDAQCDVLNGYTKERYYVGYENGCANLFREAGAGRQTVSYGNTKKELSEKLELVINILSMEGETK